MHKFINQQYLDWKEGWQRSISKQLLLCICDIFFPYNIDHSTKNVCSGIFLLKHTYALFVKVESGKNSGSEKDKHARGKRWHQYCHLSWGWLTFVFWHIERCICWIIIGGGWWLSDHLAATVSSWWGSLHTTYILPPLLLLLLPTLLAMHLQWAEGTITDPSRYLVKSYSARPVFVLLMR